MSTPLDKLSEDLAGVLDLTEEEGELVAADPNQAAPVSDTQSLSLIGRVLTERELSKNFIRANLSRLLRPVKGFDLKALDNNMFIIRFNHHLDRKKAMKGCPWVLDKYALILEPIDPKLKPEDHKLTLLPMMVRIYQISLSNRSGHVARLLGNNLGIFVDFPKAQDGFYMPYIRIQILIDTTKPLKRGIYFQGVEGSKQWVRVAYERLPLFCFLCGIIGHEEEDCPKRYEEDFQEPSSGLPYGTWMRATDENKMSRNIGGGTSQNFQKVEGLGTRQLEKRGGDIFGTSGSSRDAGGDKENQNQNIQTGLGNSQVMSWRSGAGDGMAISHESPLKDQRKKINITSNKRKKVAGDQGGSPSKFKKPLLGLRDEDVDLTAEAAEQPRRGL